MKKLYMRYLSDKLRRITLILPLVLTVSTMHAQTVVSTEVFTVGNYYDSDISDNRNYVSVVVVNAGPTNDEGIAKTLERQTDGSFTLVNSFDLTKGSGGSDAVNSTMITVSDLGINFVNYMYGWSGDDVLVRLQKNLPDGTSVTVLEYVNDGIATMKVIAGDLYTIFGAGANFDPGTLGGLPDLSGGYYLLKIDGTTDQYVWSTFLGNDFVWTSNVEILENPADPDNIYLNRENGDLIKYDRATGTNLGIVKDGLEGDKYKFDEVGNLQRCSYSIPGYTGTTVIIYDVNDNYNSVIAMNDWTQANMWNYGLGSWKIIDGIFYGLSGGRVFYLSDNLIHGSMVDHRSIINSYGWAAGQTINGNNSYSYIMVDSDNNVITMVTATFPPEDMSLVPTLNGSDPNIISVFDGKIYDGNAWVDAYHQGTLVFKNGSLPSAGDNPDPAWVNASPGTHPVILFPIELDSRSGNLIFRGVYRKDNSASDDINIRVMLTEESDVVLDSYTVSIAKVTDGGEPNSDVQFEISVSPVNTSGSAISGDIAYSGTATEGVDYNGIASFSIPDGSSYAVVSLSIIDDTEYEGTESVIAEISNLSNGSIGTASAEANILDNDESSTAVEDIEAGFSLYPNPAGDYISVRYSSLSSEPAGYVIYDITGGEVLSGVLRSGRGLISLKTLNPGVYFMKIYGKTGVFYKF